MTATAFTPADLAQHARQLDKDAEAAQRRVAEQRAAAERMADEARDAAEAAQLAEQAARATASRSYTGQMLALTAEVHTARQAAIKAVTDGGDALGAWLAYRNARAINAGRWDALKTEYQRVVGHNPPPGNWGPNVAPGRPGDENAGIHESFAQFLTAACEQHERDTRYASFVATSNEVEAARAEQPAEQP